MIPTWKSETYTMKNKFVTVNCVIVSTLDKVFMMTFQGGLSNHEGCRPVKKNISKLSNFGLLRNMFPMSNSMFLVLQKQKSDPEFTTICFSCSTYVLNPLS